jgi:hypothetical protein
MHRHRFRLTFAVPLVALLALSGCGNKKYTCSVFSTIGGIRVLVKQVTVSSRQECAALGS